MSENVRFSLKPKQLQAIEILVSMPRKFQSYKDVAVRLNISDRTLRRWKNCSNFQEALSARMKERFRNFGSDVRHAFVQQAMNGNVECIKMYFQHVEGWKG